MLEPFRAAARSEAHNSATICSARVELRFNQSQYLSKTEAPASIISGVIIAQTKQRFADSFDQLFVLWKDKLL